MPASSGLASQMRRFFAGPPAGALRLSLRRSTLYTFRILRKKPFLRLMALPEPSHRTESGSSPPSACRVPDSSYYQSST